MLGKLVKNDLKKNMRLIWILFISTIIASGITRLCVSLGENILFFKILGIFFDSVFYALAANAIIQTFLKNIFNFSKSIYGDESYLTHTLPVTKNQIVNSKFLTVLIELVLGFVCVIISLLIKFYSPTMFETIRLLISIFVIGNFSLALILSLFVVLVIVEFLMFVSIIFYSITLAHKSKEKRLLKTFLLTAAFAFTSLTVLAGVMIGVLTINGVNLSSTTLIVSSSTFIGIMLAGIIVYSAVILLFYFLTKKELNKGVNVD